MIKGFYGDNSQQIHLCNSLCSPYINWAWHIDHATQSVYTNNWWELETGSYFMIQMSKNNVLTEKPFLPQAFNCTAFVLAKEAYV